MSITFPRWLAALDMMILRGSTRSAPFIQDHTTKTQVIVSFHNGWHRNPSNLSLMTKSVGYSHRVRTYHPFENQWDFESSEEKCFYWPPPKVGSDRIVDEMIFKCSHTSVCFGIFLTRSLCYTFCRRSISACPCEMWLFNPDNWTAFYPEFRPQADS